MSIARTGLPAKHVSALTARYMGASSLSITYMHMKELLVSIYVSTPGPFERDRSLEGFSVNQITLMRLSSGKSRVGHW
jgi:hypothetical protein